MDLLFHVHKFRVEELWEKEVRRVGIKNASMSRVVIRFIGKRFIVASFVMLVYVGLYLFIVVSLFLFHCSKLFFSYNES